MEVLILSVLEAKQVLFRAHAHSLDRSSMDYIFVSVKHFSRTNLFVMGRSPKLTYHKRATRVAAELRKLQTWRPLAGSCCGFDIDMPEDSSSWEIRNEQKLA